jgi:fucose 4-O-acetylase-like acetyltransferase
MRNNKYSLAIYSLIRIFAPTMAKQRIEYIDAMRGFTMILVVYSHICHFCLGDSLLGFNGIFFLFRLPCFFMLSGWLFEPVAQRPFMANVHHKFMVQIVPTFIFLLLLAPPPEFFRQLGALKGGYWFTFVLFEFFVLYMLIARLGKRWAPWVALTIVVASFIYARYYNSIQSSAVGVQVWVVNGLGFLSVALWRFFMFFYIGAWMRRHFEAFIQWTSKPLVILIIVLVFFAIASTPHLDNIWYEMARFYVGGITGMWMVFTCFRLSISWLQKLHLSQPLQYVGTRTLDIYLLHYFFLPRFLMPYADQLKAYDSQIIEFLVIMGMSFIVLAITLLASYIIRISPFLGHYLFGVKYENYK